MLSDINVGEVGAFSGFVVAALAVGSVIGRSARDSFRERAQRQHEEIQIKQAIVGKPADEFGPRIPGLVEQMITLAHRIDKIESRFEGHLRNERVHEGP
jgi:hypothetical protein